MATTYITSFIRIKNNQVLLNGELYFDTEAQLHFADFIRALYKQTAINYPKFYKMDDLSKLAILGASILLDKLEDSYDANEKSILLSNKSASLDTDYKHQEAVNAGLASPAIFVYTLPNICIGEIAIKYKIMGENAFFVSEQFQPKQLYTSTEILHQESKSLCSICGWVEYFQNDYELFLYTVEQKPQLNVNALKKMPIFTSLLENKGALIHHPKNIELLYK
ncbi:MAG: 3-oxoacyl-ACP synthase [Bacteroidota bacterium]